MARKMTEIQVADKEKYLAESDVFETPPKLNEKMQCLHCGKVITVGDYKVFKHELIEQEFICCPNAPECGGTAIDWLPLRDQ